MGMVLTYRRVPTDRLNELIADPELFYELLEEEEAGELADTELLDIDKAWHGIHFLLNQQTWEGEGPLFNVALGGAPLGDLELGYGPVRYLTASEVRETAAALSGISAEELAGRYVPATLQQQQIYPEIWDQGDALEYLLEYYSRVVAFFRGAAEQGEAIVLFLN